MKENIPTFLLEKLKEQYSPSVVETIIKGYQTRLTTFRINTLKITKAEAFQILSANHFIIEEVPWCPFAFVLKNKTEKDLQLLELYQNGSIYVQSLSSMLPPLILNPERGEHILDMCASPGSKTTQIAMQTCNLAPITAVEKNYVRAERLKYNLKKQGVTCCTVLNMDATSLDEFFTFDKILLDAPCSGSGTILLGERDYKTFTFENMEHLKKTQQKLLRKALQIAKPKQKILYSTCSILREENEEIIKSLQKEFSFRILPITISTLNVPLLPTILEGTLCIAPCSTMEGFFIALLEKN